VQHRLQGCIATHPAGYAQIGCGAPSRVTVGSVDRLVRGIGS
jgi:hypothetical protein